MPHGGDWLPGKRETILMMAGDWVTVLGTKAAGWNIPTAEVTALSELTNDAGAKFQTAQSAERTPVITAECKAAFQALEEKMRFFKSRYFLVPPLTDADLISLQLKPKDTTHTTVPVPADQCGAEIYLRALHQLGVKLTAITKIGTDDERANYGFRIYYGVMPQGGADVQAATGTKRELMAVPVSGEELPHSKFTRRKKDVIDFAQEDSGKVAYICPRYENSKGEAGPWGPIISAVIP